jgi:hypothetical protein
MRRDSVSLGILNLIDSNGVDLTEYPVFESEDHDVFHRVGNLSQEVRNASAVSFHESRRAQRARNNI